MRNISLCYIHSSSACFLKKFLRKNQVLFFELQLSDLQLLFTSAAVEPTALVWPCNSFLVTDRVTSETEIPSKVHIDRKQALRKG